jgi:hypothetical protein
MLNTFFKKTSVAALTKKNSVIVQLNDRVLNARKAEIMLKTQLTLLFAVRHYYSNPLDFATSTGCVVFFAYKMAQFVSARINSLISLESILASAKTIAKNPLPLSFLIQNLELVFRGIFLTIVAIALMRGELMKPSAITVLSSDQLKLINEGLEAIGEDPATNTIYTRSDIARLLSSFDKGKKDLARIIATVNELLPHMPSELTKLIVDYVPAGEQEEAGPNSRP